MLIVHWGITETIFCHYNRFSGIFLYEFDQTIFVVIKYVCLRFALSKITSTRKDVGYIFILLTKLSESERLVTAGPNSEVFDSPNIFD